MNKLFYGDNLDVLRDHIADESVDLSYLDPPFNSDANYTFENRISSTSFFWRRAFEMTGAGCRAEVSP